MLDTIIKHIFKTTTYKLKKLNKGITNQNYSLIVHDQTYIVRVPYPDNTHVFARSQEAKVLEMVTELDVPTIYFDLNTGIKITKYIPNLYEYAQCPYEDKIERCARLLKKLHKKPAPSFAFHPIETLYKYKQKVEHPSFDLTPYEHVIEQVKHLQHRQVLCHNDVVSGNLLFGQQKDYLIDYEYAASNDALFDVMSFISENDIYDPMLRQRFYAVYFDVLTPAILHDLSLWEAFHNLLWCYWAMMLYERRQDPIYQQIAEAKYTALKKMKP